MILPLSFDPSRAGAVTEPTCNVPLMPEGRLSDATLANYARINTVMEATLQQAAKAFSDAIKTDETVSRFFEAKEAYDSNDEVYQLRLQYTQLVHDLRMKQNEGTLGEEDISGLRELEQQVNNHPETQKLSQAQSSAIELLQSCNTRISERLGFDYGSSAASAKGCGCS